MIYSKKDILFTMRDLFDEAERDYGAPGLSRAYLRMNVAARLFDRAPVEWNTVLNEVTEVINDEIGDGNLEEVADPNTHSYIIKRLANGSTSSQTTSVSTTKSPVNPINNHVCIVCGNDKLNKTEKSCWKCGTAIK